MRIAWAFAGLLTAVSLAGQSFPEHPPATLALYQNDERIDAIGSDGKDFLAVGFRYGAGVIAHRITASGEVLDGPGIPITPDRPENALIRLLGVFWGGDAYTIVWQWQSGVYVTRIDRDGRVVNGSRFIVETGAAYDGAASNGSRIVLASQRVTVLDIRGNLIDTGEAVPANAQPVGAYSVAWNGTEFMLSWVSSEINGDRGVNVAPLNADGRPLGPLGKVIVPMAASTSIASDGDDFMVVSRSSTAVFSHRVNAAGEIVQTRTIATMSPGPPRIIWTGQAYVVAAAASGAPSTIRLDRGGNPIDAAPVSISSPSGIGTYALLAASNGSQGLLAWATLPPDGSPSRSFAVMVGSDGRRTGDVIALGMTPMPQFAPAIATSGVNFMVVWQEIDGAIYASRLTYAGEPLDGRGILLSKTRRGRGPRVVWDGQTYVVAWLSGDDFIATAHITADGKAIGNAENVALTGCGEGLDLATDGDTALIVASCGGIKIRAVRVHRDGIPEPSILVSRPDALSVGPRVAWNGKEYLVVWSTKLTRTSVLGARISPDMTLLDPEPLRIAASDTEDNTLGLVAWNGSQFMTAWGRAVEGGTYARPVNRDGTLGVVTPKVANRYASSLIWDGRRYVLGLDFLGVAELGQAPFALTGSARDFALAPAGDGALLAAYVRQAPEYGSVFRVFVRGLGPEPPRARAVRR